MKKLTTLLFFAFVFISTGLHAQTEVPTTLPTQPSVSGGGGGGGSVPAPVIDGEQAARTFVSQSLATFSGSCRGQIPNGSERRNLPKNTIFIDPKTKWVVKIIIDDKIVMDENDPPLPGLPSFGGPVENFSFWVDGFTKEWVSVIYGGFSTPLLSEGDSISILLRSNWLPYFLPFKLPEGVDPNNLYLRNLLTGANIRWNAEKRGFEVWMNPMDSPGYEIYDLWSGAVYDRGVINYWYQPGPNRDSAINFTYAGGVVNAELDPYGNRTIITDRFGSNVIRDGQPVPASVYFTDLQGRAPWIEVGNVYGRVQVRQYVEEGEMPLIADVECPEGFVSLGLPEGYGRVVITVTGKLQYPDMCGVELYLRTWSPKG